MEIISNGKLQQTLKNRHMTMIALGGVIGAGLFVGSGTVIHNAGPSAILAYLISGVIMVMVMKMLGEMATLNPSSGSFSEYARDAIGPWAGFMVGWLYWFHWIIVIAIEAIAGAAIINAWLPGIPMWVLTLVLTLLLTLTNVLSVKSFGEFEYWFSMIKVASIIIFLILGVALIFGVVGTNTVGVSNLLDHGGFFPNGIGAVFASILVVIFSFAGAEVVTIAAAESENPKKSISKAINSTIWRVLIFYVGSILVIVTLLPWDSASILQSPYVAVLENNGIKFAAQLMSIIVLTAVLSCLNSGLYTSSRMLFALAQRGEAPKLFMNVNDKGVPVQAVLAATLSSCAALVMNFISPEKVFVFLANSDGTIILLVFLSIAVSQLLSRKKIEKTEPEKLTAKMWLFPYLTYATIAVILSILMAMAIVESLRSQFFSAIILVVITLVCYWLFVKRKVSN